MAIHLTRAERAELARNGGAAVLPLPSAKGQPKRVYYNRYNEPCTLPADPRNIEHYLGRGFTLTPRENPDVRATATLVGAADWTVEEVEAEAATGPAATYYTADGTPVPGLPADPESMAAYLAQGLSLSRPVVAAATEQPRRKRRFRRAG